MTYQDLAKFHNQNTPSNVEVVFVEDQDVRQEDVFVQGWFDPNWFENGDDTPVRVEVIVWMDSDVPEEDIEAWNNEIVVAVNHELVHNEQNEEGRFIEDWEGSYEDNTNEIEAYSRENNKEFYE